MALQRLMQQLVFRFGIRPAALFLVLACAGLVFALVRVRRASLVAAAVTSAPSAVLASLVPARVSRIHVALGQRVVAGQLLVTLSAPEFEAERDEIDARIRRLSRAAEVAQLELMRGLNAEQRQALTRLSEAQRDARRAEAEQHRAKAEEVSAATYFAEAERLAQAGMLDPGVAAERGLMAAKGASQHEAAGALVLAENARLGGLRREMDRLGTPNVLVAATAELYEAELEVLERRRVGVTERLATLSIRAPLDGFVAELMQEGSVAVVGASVARVVPPFASNVVAYLPPDAPPPVLAGKVAFTVLLADGRQCHGAGQPRSAFEVVRKPEQLVPPGSYAAYGFPISIPLDAQCRLPIGQVVELRLGTP